jgi:hypothetical protein
MFDLKSRLRPVFGKSAGPVATDIRKTAKGKETMEKTQQLMRTLLGESVASCANGSKQ